MGGHDGNWPSIRESYLRYGSLVPGESVSYTELEFHAATSAGIPRLVFLLDETAGLADSADPGGGAAKQFRQRLRDAGLIVRTFTSADRLELEVYHALSELSRSTTAEPSVAFAVLLQQWRTELGLTPQELAQRARLNLVSVSELEHGRAGIPDEATVRMLADTLKLTGTRRIQFTAAAARLPAQPARPFDNSILSGAAVPQIWNAPNRNADSTGRVDILRRLHDDLAGGGTAIVLARAVYGLGGVGKTQIALEYAHRFKPDYDLIWWIDAERPQEISLSLADLAARLGLQISNSAEAAAAVLDQLRRDTRGRWLLIFDNAEDPEELSPFLPTGSGHIIITSRNQAWTRHAAPVELDVFTQEESLAHLMRHVPGLSAANALRVSTAVGQLPLAVEQAAAWLAETGMPPARYAAWLETQATTALGLNKPLDYALPVVATWNLSFDRLQQRSPAAVRLLQILAFCSPGLGRDHQQTLQLQFLVGNILRSLGRFTDAHELDTYVLEQQSAVLGADHPHALMTANALAADLRALGDFEEALARDRATYQSYQEQFGEDHPRTLKAAHNLGCALRLAGDYTTARRLDGETLRRQLQVRSDRHPDTLLGSS